MNVYGNLLIWLTSLCSNVDIFLPGIETDWQSIDISLGSLIKLPAEKLPDNNDPTIDSLFKLSNV